MYTLKITIHVHCSINQNNDLSEKKKCHSHKAKFELKTYMYNQGYS